MYIYYETGFRRILNAILTLLLCIMFVVCIFAIFVTALAPKGADGASELWGYEMRIVTSNSMEECELTDVSDYEIKDIPVYSMVFVDKLPKTEEKIDDWYADLEVGDVLTVRYAYVHQITITHRITSITEKEDGGYIIELAGDNKNSDADQLYQKIDTSDVMSPNYVIGRVVGQSHWMGVVISTMQRFFKSLMI